jgi:hypothetical protein
MQYMFVFTPIYLPLLYHALCEGVEIPTLPPNLITLRDVERVFHCDIVTTS